MYNIPKQIVMGAFYDFVTIYQSYNVY
jgi:hypothetical protein